MNIKKIITEKNNKDMFNKFYILFFTFVLLFFPAKYYYAYHVAILLPLFFYSIFMGFSNNKYTKFLLCFYCYLFLSTFIRFLLEPNEIKDFYELFRFVPLLFLLGTVDKIDFTSLKRILVPFIISFIVLNFIVCYLQVNFKASSLIVNIIHEIYNSDVHFTQSLLISSRALGFMTGPGDNAVVMLICTYFIYFYFKPSSFILSSLRLVILMLGIGCIVMSQSQTVVIAFAASFALLQLVMTLKKPLLNGVRVFVMIVIGMVYIITSNDFNDISDKGSKLYYLSTIEQGTERSSYKVRIEKREYFLNKAEEKYYYLPIGWGKSYFGDRAGSTDNEHLYIALIYGPVVWGVMCLLIFIKAVARVKKYLLTGAFEFLFFPVIAFSWLLIAIPAAMLTNPQSLILIALFLFYDKKYFEREAT